MNNLETVQQMIDECDMLLIGIGAEFSEKKASKEEVIKAYQTLQQMVKGKPWFLLTLNTDDLVYEAGLSEFFIVAPCGSDKTGNVITNEDYDESAYLPQWECYMNYLSATLGKKLLILELGIGMEYPSVVRIPFERTVTYNMQAKLIRINSKLAFVPEEIEERSLTISSLPVDFLNNLNK